MLFAGRWGNVVKNKKIKEKKNKFCCFREKKKSAILIFKRIF